MSDEQTQPPQIVLTVEQAIANLQSPDPSQRYYAAWWLGKMRAREAVDALLEALADADDVAVQGGYPLKRNAARALGMIKDIKAIPALLEALECNDFYVREAAAQAIESIATTAKGFEAAQTCISRLIELLETSDFSDRLKPKQPYEAILEALGRLKASAAQDLVKPFLQHRWVRLRLAAARSMYGITGNPDYAEQLIVGLSDADINIRRIALTDLGEIAYLPAASAIFQCQIENSFKLFALKSILEFHLPNFDYDPNLSEPLQQIMLWMDDLL